jgi:hypothetical protein
MTTEEAGESADGADEFREMAERESTGDAAGREGQARSDEGAERTPYSTIRESASPASPTTDAAAITRTEADSGTGTEAPSPDRNVGGGEPNSR